MSCARARQIATSVPQGILVDHTPDARVGRSPDNQDRGARANLRRPGSLGPGAVTMVLAASPQTGPPQPEHL